jgi:pimeloyl-ACP methyl ester carboxylesterase
MSQKLFTSLMIVLIITACAPATPALTPTPTLAPLFAEKVDVGGYKLQILCSGQGTLTVIVDAELGDPAVESGNWLSVRYGVEKTTRICVYDRASLGSSDAPPTQPRTSQDMANDLHTLLVNANVPGPYILVGHNLGGYNVRLYSNQYPDEVVGMVLVDAFHPDQVSETLAALPPESPDEPDSLKRTREFLTNQIHNTSNLENLDYFASADLVRATNGLGDLPLVVLTHRPSWRGGDPYFPMDVAAQIEQVGQNLQIDLAGLSSNSTHVIATKAGPNIPLDEPQLVIDAILQVIDDAKK